MEKPDSFASDVVKQVLKDYRRFIIILIVFIFVNNLAWLRDDAAQMMRSRLESMANEPMSENNRLAIMDCLNKIK